MALRHEWRRATRDSNPLSLILCDIDCFKGYNDTYGHPAGDEVLVRVSESMRASLRRPADLAARYGGEEFVVILANTDSEGAVALAEKIRGAVEQMRILHEASTVEEWLTVSFGVATLIPTSAIEPEELIDRADRALYAAKQSGRNRVCTDGPRPIETRQA
jgi:diguanylate cyclase (GGDEF)-like protein